MLHASVPFAVQLHELRCQPKRAADRPEAKPLSHRSVLAALPFESNSSGHGETQTARPLSQLGLRNFDCVVHRPSTAELYLEKQQARNSHLTFHSYQSSLHLEKQLPQGEHSTSRSRSFDRTTRCRPDLPNRLHGIVQQQTPTRSSTQPTAYLDHASRQKPKNQPFL